MGDSQVTLDGESPFDSWPTMSSPGRATPPAASGANRPAPRRVERYEEDRTRVDIPALSASAGGPEMTHDPQPKPPEWPLRSPQAPALPQAPQVPQAQPPLTPPDQFTHVPWTVASSWGASSLNTPNTLAGLSYLFWWVSGLWVYFNERHNRFVRFHAVQSILLTGALTVASVVLYILWELSGDLSAATRQPAFAHVGQGIAFLGFLGVIGLWLGPMIAAWSGHHVRLPIVGAYAERYAAPPREPFPPSPFAD